jgi:tetratricopeptide (TPR) repeat protein
MIKHIAGRAIETLRLRRTKLEEDLFDLVERVESEDWQQTTLDLVDWLFWQDERAAWRELVPRFVEGLGYNRDFAESLLVVANNFELKLSKDGRKRLKQLQLAEDNRDTMLTELERLAQKGRWLDDDDAEATAERQTILLLWRGHWQAGQGQLNQALQTYLAAESHLPKQATNLRLQLGQGFNHLSQKFIWPQGREFWSIPSEPGLQAAQRAVTLNPENKSAWFRFGLALIGQRDPQQALAVFQQGIQISPEEGSLWRGQGVAYRDLGQYEETIQSLRRALELNPRDATAWFHLGSVSRILDRYEEAIEAYQQAINLGHPRLVSDSQRNLSYLYRDLGRYDEAIEICQQGVELNPKAASLHIALGGLYELKENLEEALQHYRQAVELQPDNGTGHASLALGLRQLGREIEAAEHLARARELMAKEDDYNKACIEAIIGDTEAALDHLTLAFAQRPRLRNWAQRDPDLASLHGHPRFEALVGNEGGP